MLSPAARTNSISDWRCASYIWFASEHCSLLPVPKSPMTTKRVLLFDEYAPKTDAGLISVPAVKAASDAMAWRRGIWPIFVLSFMYVSVPLGRIEIELFVHFWIRFCCCYPLIIFFKGNLR